MAFRDLSIRVKLPVVVMATSGIALVLAGGTQLLVTQLNKQRDMEDQVRVLAGTLAEQAAPATAFDQPEFAVTLLTALREVKHITGAAIFRADGRELARYDRRDKQASRIPPSPEPGSLHVDGAFVHTERILQGGKAIGTLTLQSDMSPVTESLKVNLLVTLVALLLALGTALLFALMISKVITRPVSELAGTMQEVIQGGDYTLQAPAHGADEVGSLIQGFNNMITRIQKREEALQRTHAELQERQAELSTYHDLVTHDVTNFGGTLQVVIRHLLSGDEGKLAESQEKLLKRANRQIFQLNKLAENAKTLVRLRDKGLPSPGAPVRLRDLVDRIVEVVRSVHFDRAAEFHVEMDASLTVAGIPFLENILLNILDNAVRHTVARTPVKVGVHGRRDGDRVEVRVRGGDAVPPEFLGRIFQRYTRGKESAGGGLGLSVVREILERFGGEVSGRNVDEDGAEVFEITLMLKAA